MAVRILTVGMTLKYFFSPDGMITPDVSQLISIILSTNAMDMFTRWQTITISYDKSGGILVNDNILSMKDSILSHISYIYVIFN